MANIELNNAASPLSPVGAKLFGADAAGNAGWMPKDITFGKYAPTKIASQSTTDSIEYVVGAGAPTVTVDVSPEGKPCLKIVATEYSEIQLPQLIGQQYRGNAFVALYGSKTLTGAGTIELRMYQTVSSVYKRGIRYQATSPLNSYVEQGGATVLHFNKSNTTDVGGVSATFEIAQARLVINPNTSPCTVYLYAVGIAAPRKSRLAVVFDDGWKSAFTLGLDPFASRGINVTQSVIADRVGTAGYADKDMLASFVAGGNACVAHGPIPVNGSLTTNYVDADLAIDDILYNIKFLRDNNLLTQNAEKCYVFPQGQFQWEASDTSLLDLMIENGIYVSRSAIIAAVADLGYCHNIDSCGKYQRLAQPIIGHSFAGTTAGEATNISNIVTKIQNLVSANGQDAYLMLHKVVPTATVDGSMDAQTIRVGDLNTIAAAIKTAIDAGTLEAVTMPQFYGGDTYWSRF